MILRLNSEHFQISEQKHVCIHQNSALMLNCGQFEICELKYICFAMITCDILRLNSGYFPILG